MTATEIDTNILKLPSSTLRAAYAQEHISNPSIQIIHVEQKESTPKAISIPLTMNGP